MYYIKSKPNDSGYHGNPQDKKIDGYVVLPEEMLNTYLDAKGFVDITIKSDMVKTIAVNQQALDAYLKNYPVYSDTPAQKREECYRTERIIEWDNRMLTVDEAEDLFGKYFAEGNQEIYESLRTLIAQAKASIREHYPD